MNEYLPPSPPVREEPVADFSPSPSPPRRQPANMLLVILVSIGMCLLLLVVLTMGTINASSAYGEIQTSYVTQTRAAPGLPPPGWKPILEERFEDKDSSLWESDAWRSDTAFVRTFVEGGSYHWILDPNSEEGTGWLVGPDLSVRGGGNLYVAVDFWLTDGRESGMGYGLIYRYADEEHFYEFSILRNQIAGVYSRDDGEWIELLPAARTNLLQPGEPNRLTVLATGSHHVFYINDHYFAELDNDTIISGGVGLSAQVYTGEEMSMQFDNFALYTP